MSSDKRVKVPIIRQGKDIARLIFEEDKEENNIGKFDIKIDLFGKPFFGRTYKLFQNTPEEWNVESPDKTTITYHHGKNNKPITIHLKNGDTKSTRRYNSVAMDHLIPPSRNTRYPIPLFKLEIPTVAADASSKYRKKSKHHLIDIQNDNTVEFYMASPSFDLSKFDSSIYSKLLCPQFFMPIEYFASYKANIDTIKHENFIPKDEPQIRMIGIGNLPNMQLFVIKYTWPKMDENLDKIRMTLLENELAEEILLCTRIAYGNTNPITDECDSIWLGGATLSQLAPNIFSNGILPESTVQETLKNPWLSGCERYILSNIAANARRKLYNAWNNHLRKQSLSKTMSIS